MAQANIKAVITAKDEASQTLKGFSDNVSGVGSNIVSIAKKASLALIAAGTAAGGFALKSAADFEQTRIGLENMLGSADKARKLLGDISKFAADTPFEFPELAQATRQLVAFGFSADEAFSTMKQLGDVSAAVGAPINDLAYLMGTLRTQGRAFTIDIRQFAQRGIPIYEYLAKVLGKNEQQIAAMIEAGKIGFPEVQKAFQAMTAEGGKFHNTMSKQSKSLSGLFSTLKDNIGQTARELVGITQTGDIIEGSPLDKLKNVVTDLITNLPAFIDRLKEVASQIADYLGPKFEALFNTIAENWPTIKLLAEAFGVALVLAIGLAIDWINLFVNIFGGIFSWIIDNKWTVLALAGTFTALAVAMNFNSIVSNFLGLMDLVIGKVFATKAATEGLATYLTGSGAAAFGVIAAAAVVAAAVIIDAGNRTKAAWDNASRAVQSASNSNDAVIKNLQNLSKNGTPEQRERAKITLKKLAETGSFATGGFTGVGNVNDIAGIVHKGEYVVPKSQVDQSTGTPKIGSNQTFNITIQAGAYMGNQQDARKYAQMIMDAWNDLQSSRGVMA